MKYHLNMLVGLSVVLLSGCNLTTSTSGVGRITSSDGNIHCGWYRAACSHSYESGDSVTLTAEAAPHYEFVGWEGACSGQDDCTVSLNQTRSVTAVFEPQLGQAIPVEELEFNDVSLKACVNHATDREGWVFNTDVTALECKGQSTMVSNHGVSINSLQGMQLFTNLAELSLRQRCFLTGPLVINQACDGPTPTDFTPLASLPLESLVVEGGWYERDVLLVRASQYRIGAFPELPLLTNVEISGLINAKVPDISRLSMLETFKVEQMGDGFISLGAIAEGAGENLTELTTITSELPCAEIDSAFSNHSNLLINGKTAADIHSCQN